jgi:hypothetical protein
MMDACVSTIVLDDAVEENRLVECGAHDKTLPINATGLPVVDSAIRVASFMRTSASLRCPW